MAPTRDDEAVPAVAPLYSLVFGRERESAAAAYLDDSERALAIAEVAALAAPAVPPHRVRRDRL